MERIEEDNIPEIPLRQMVVGLGVSVPFLRQVSFQVFNTKKKKKRLATCL